MVTPRSPPEDPPNRDTTRGSSGRRGDSSGGSLHRDIRGQALTLEAVTAAILLLTAVGFALQMTSVTPLSASTSSQHLENQLQSTGEGVLASGQDTGALEEAVLFWNESEDAFHGTIPGVSYYRQGFVPNRFGEILNESYRERNIAFNVVIYYQTKSGGERRQRLVHQGEPSDHAVSASRTIVLTDDDKLRNPDGTLGAQLNGTNFYAPDAGVESGGDRLYYNLLRIEVIAWRI